MAFLKNIYFKRYHLYTIMFVWTFSCVSYFLFEMLASLQNISSFSVCSCCIKEQDQGKKNFDSLAYEIYASRRLMGWLVTHWKFLLHFLFSTCLAVLQLSWMTAEPMEGKWAFKIGLTLSAFSEMLDTSGWDWGSV